MRIAGIGTSSDGDLAMRSPNEQQQELALDNSNDQGNNIGNNFNRTNDAANVFEFSQNIGNNEMDNFINELQVEVVKVMTWNSSGLSNNLDRLIRSLKRDRVHLAIVQETWYHPDRHIPDVCVFNALASVTPNLNRGVNGVSVVVNPEFASCPHIKNMVCTAKDTVNGCFLVIELAGIKIVGMYNAPSHPLELELFLDEIARSARLSPTEPIIFAGDFNARRMEWGDTRANDDGPKLEEWMRSWSMERCNTGPAPTCTTARGNSIVDHVFSNLPEIAAKLIRRPVPSADHVPIEFSFNPRTFVYTQPDRSYMRIKREALRDRETRTNFGYESMLRNGVLTDAISALTTELSTEGISINAKQQALDSSDKKFRDFFLGLGKRILGQTRAGKRPLEYIPLYSEALETLYTQQEAAPTRAGVVAISRELCRLKRQRFLEFAEKISGKPPSDVLKVVAQINGNRRSRLSSLQDTKEALAEYAEYFAGMNTNSLPHPTNRGAAMTIEPDMASAESFAASAFTTERIFSILYDVPWNKAAGNSGVCYDFIKAADFSVISLVSQWFRIIFCSGLVPSSWTRSMLVPVPKKGDLNKINNYRPISLTESFRKIFEHCLVRSLVPIAGPMHFSQGGFRADHCCSDMISSLHEVLSKNKDMHVAFLDIKAAYDSVDREILWRRCRSRGFDDGIIRILQRLFDHNSSQVVVNGKRSQPFGIKAGLLQGSVLSPFLYSIFIDDLAEELLKHPKVKVGDLNLNCTMYADDVAVFARSAQVLQLLLHHCQKHANMNRYRFNVGKCTVIGDGAYNYSLDGNLIPKVDYFIYLGVEIGRKGILFKEYISRRCENAITAGMRLIAMGMNLGGFSPHISAMLYKVFIRSKLEAGINLIPENKQLAKKLEAAQRKILARLFFCGPNSSGTIVRSLTNTPTMEFRMKYLRSRYVHRTNALEPTHIVRSIMKNRHCLLNKMKKNIYTKEECTEGGKERLKLAEMTEVHATTCAATRGHLVIPADGQIPWFLRKRLDPMLRKRICHWVLKKCPAAKPGRCGMCESLHCSQSHIAECRNILGNFSEISPARFRPEAMLSNPETCLYTVGVAINRAVSRCLPHLNLS